MMTGDLRALLFPSPATQIVQTERPPKARKSCCAKCPFGGAKLTPGERQQAETIKAQIAERISMGEPVIWGCHETTRGKAPQICAGFLKWTRGNSK